MLSKFRWLFDKIESDNTGLHYWLIAFVAVVFVRNFLEGALEAQHSLLAPELFFVDFLALYVLLFLGLLILLRILTKASLESLIKVLVVLFILIITVPIIDFFVSSGNGYWTKSLRGGAGYLVENFTTYFSTGATIGQKIEALAFGSLLAIYLFIKTKNPLKTAAGIMASYLIFFSFAAVPSLIYLLSNLFFSNPLAYSISAVRGEFLGGSLALYITGEVINSVVMVIILLELAALLYLSDKRVFNFVKKSIRPLRLVHYTMLAGFGLLMGFYVAGGFKYDLYNFLFSLTFLLSAATAYQFASSVNDFFDMDMHTRLKIPQKAGDLKNIKILAVTLLVMSLLLAYPLGVDVVIVMATFASLSYAYSAPPLRLKKYPILASLTLASCALTMVLGGFAVFAKEETIMLFPPSIAMAILVVYTLGTNYKDLKDVKLDKENKVYTIPVLLGERKGKAVVALMTISSFLLVPLILGISALWLPSLLAAGLSPLFISKNLDEKYFRIMHLAYLCVAAYLILL